MRSWRSLAALSLLLAGSLACGSSPAAPSSAPLIFASIEIAGLTATVEPLLTTSPPGLSYRLVFVARETRGQIGATLERLRFEFSDGRVAEGPFTSTPRVDAGRTVPLVATYSIYPAVTPAASVNFSITFTDDNGKAGTATASASISPVE